MTLTEMRSVLITEYAHLNRLKTELEMAKELIPECEISKEESEDADYCSKDLGYAVAELGLALTDLKNAIEDLKNVRV